MMKLKSRTQRSSGQPARSALLAILIGSAILAGCATSPLTVENVHSLRPGITTREEALAVLGPTDTYSNYADGTVLVQWMDVNAMRGFHVAILFDKAGRMIRVQHLSVS